MHLAALRQMGLVIDETHGRLNCYCEDELKGCEIALPMPSVGATENIMLAASTANGTTVIRNAAREPEIVDLADFLNSCGAKIYSAGESTITVEGVKKLNGAEHHVIPDRIVAATYMSAVAAAGGQIELANIIPAHLYPTLPVFEEAGCVIDMGKDYLKLASKKYPYRRISRISDRRATSGHGYDNIV